MAQGWVQAAGFRRPAIVACRHRAIVTAVGPRRASRQGMLKACWLAAMGRRGRDGRMHAPYVLLSLLVRPGEQLSALVETWSDVGGVRYTPPGCGARAGAVEFVTCCLISNSKSVSCGVRARGGSPLRLSLSLSTLSLTVTVIFITRVLAATLSTVSTR